MKKILLVSILALFVQFGSVAGERKSLNNNWLFHTGESVPEASTISFDDSSWSKTTIPYDYSYISNGQAWFRKHFSISESEKGNCFSIRFDGIAGSCDVYINGVCLGHNLSIGVSKVFDVSPYVLFGKDNVLAVHTSGDVFQCANGIVRDVYLLKSAGVHIPEFSTRVRADFGRVQVMTQVENSDCILGSDVYANVNFVISDMDGKVVSTFQCDPVRVLPFECADIKADMHISIPHMWDLDDPYMYTLKTVVSVSGIKTDEETVRFGVRDVVYDSARGFVLNNRKVSLHGVNVYDDHAGVGAAIPRELWRYRLSRLKEFGVAAIRFPEGPANPTALELCDEMGILVIEDNGSAIANPESIDRLRAMITRDFNHPSVVMWGIGSEDSFADSYTSGVDVVRKLSGICKLEDQSRPTVYLSSNCDNSGGAADVTGISRFDTGSADREHTSHPSWRFIGMSEPTGAVSRAETSVIIDGQALNQISSSMDFYEGRKWEGGVFFQSGFDFRTADGLQQCGVFDRCGFPKNEAYFLQACWTWKPVLHICGEYDEKVSVYTNCETVELSANGKNLGLKAPGTTSYLSWKLSSPGAKKFSAKGVFKGKLTKAVSLKESYPTVLKGMEYSLSKDKLVADGQDVVVLEISSSKETAYVLVSGPVTVLGWGNGNPSLSSNESNLPDSKAEIAVPVYAGKAQVLLRSVEGQPGEITVRVDGKSSVLFSY